MAIAGCAVFACGSRSASAQTTPPATTKAKTTATSPAATAQTGTQSNSMVATPTGGPALPSGPGAPLTTADGAVSKPDSAANASPLSVLNDRYGLVPVDSSTASGYVAAPPKYDGVPVGTKIQVQLSQGISSKDAKNGQVLTGKLASPLKTTLGKTLPAGTTVVATVIESAPAGQITSFGELMLQVVKVGSLDVLTDYVYVKGQEGHKELPDAAPDKGTDATVGVQPLDFTIPKPAPPPTA